MGDKYIIELEEKPFHKDNGDFLYRVKGFNSLVFDMNGIQKLIPYAESDIEKVKREAYMQGVNDANYAIADDSYKKGLSDAWEAARKIILDKEDGGLDPVTYNEIFGYGKGVRTVLKIFTASEAIEKIRQYEQEKEYENFYEIQDALNTTMKECNATLDKIAEVLRKMKGEST